MKHARIVLLALGFTAGLLLTAAGVAWLLAVGAQGQTWRVNVALKAVEGRGR